MLSRRPLWDDEAAALDLAKGAGVHGAYVRNALAAGDGDGFLFACDSAGPGLVWIGPRGNLVVLGGEQLPPASVTGIVDHVFTLRLPWRIAMGPADLVDALRQRSVVPPLVCREQVYYQGSAQTAAAALVRDDMRRAQRADRDRLVQATLLLNASDLNLDPARVDRRWLRDTIDERIADGSTCVLGPVGGPLCKLDYGSDGPGGLMLEGVFTFAEHRGQGLAAALVASCLRAAPGAVLLHVGQHNHPARAAYERAGMQAAGSCRLLLLG